MASRHDEYKMLPASRSADGFPPGMRLWASGHAACAVFVSDSRLDCGLLFDGVPESDLGRILAKLAAGTEHEQVRNILTGTDRAAGLALAACLASEGAMDGYVLRYAPGAPELSDTGMRALAFGRDVADWLGGSEAAKLRGIALEELSAAAGRIECCANPGELVIADQGEALLAFAVRAGSVYEIFRLYAAGRIDFAYYAEGGTAGMRVLPGNF